MPKPDRDRIEPARPQDASGSARASEARGSAKRGLDRFLRWLAADPVLCATANPLDVVTEELARVLDVDWAFASELLDDPPGTVRTASWWRDGRLCEPVEYPFAGSPCEPACQGLPYCCPRRVVDRFPMTVIQEAEGIEGYASHPLSGESGAPIGLVGVMSRRPFADPRRIQRFLAACAPRVAGELRQLMRRRELERAASTCASDLGVAHARERRLLALVRERDVLLREVHHRVKGNLQMVISLLVMQADASEDPALRHAMAEAVSRISAIAIVHALLSEGQTRSAVDMKGFVEQMADNLQRTFDPSRERVTIELSLDAVALPLRLAVPCGLLIAELVTNAFQHAFAGTGRGVIAVRLGATADDITIVVRDDGRWVPSDGPGGLGLRLIRLLATRQLGGTLSVEHSDGTEFTVRFPVTGQESADVPSETAMDEEESAP